MLQCARAAAISGLVAITSILAVPARAALVTNGGFETGDFSGWTQSGNTGFTGVYTGIQHSGTWAGAFGPVGSLGFIEQDLATVAGETYRLTYWLRSDRGPDDVFEASWDGTLVTSITDSAAVPYTEFSFDLVAADSSTTLQFGFRQDWSYWFIDDISVDLVPTSVPEPGTLALFGSAVVGMVALRRRQR